jgi:NadR type nicotinamide-nucleotide adenylyltransferase
LNLKRISVTGPESTGKSELAKELSAYYGTLYVPEYAREYLTKLGRAYVFDDIAEIARGQMELESRLAEKAGKLLFCDTDPLVTKIWSSFKYGKCDPWIEEQVTNHRYDLYLLCGIDLPWEADPMRENPDEREEIFNLYLEELQLMKAPFSIISGMGERRLRNAILAVKMAFE